jgi:putative FmdB family regulatory protein
MPIYEYRCATCGVRFERMTSFSDTTIATCPNGHIDTRRVFSPPGIVFKGSGFYVTDNRLNSKSNSADD